VLTQQLQHVAGLLRANDHQEALNALTAIAPLGTHSADFWQLQALAHKGLGHFEEAEGSFLTSLQLLPQPHVLTNLANF